MPNRPYKGVLVKPIDVGELRPKGLMATVGTSISKEDVRRFRDEKEGARWRELDKQLELGGDEVWEVRARALAERHLKIPARGGKGWRSFAELLASEFVPGFTYVFDTKQRGAPKRWSDERYAQIYADVELFKKRYPRLSVEAVCRRLPKHKAYTPRWGKTTPTALQKAYSQAVRLHKDDLYKIRIYGLELPRGADPVPMAIEKFALKI
jgi:hypothetical protein